MRSEEFREAARLKAQLEELNRSDPVMAAKTALQKAIAEERYKVGRGEAIGWVRHAVGRSCVLGRLRRRFGDRWPAKRASFLAGCFRSPSHRPTVGFCITRQLGPCITFTDVATAMQEAAEIQARIKQLETELGAAVLDSGLLSTSSDTVTHGIRVQVQR